MISDKTVLHFQHCDHQLTLVIVVQFIVRRLGKFQKKHKTETSYDITTTTYKKNTLKNIATNETAIY
jgi:hypothetical protein